MPTGSPDSMPGPISLRGWRVVRIVGTSSTATTALVVPLSGPEPARSRVLRLFSASTPDDQVDHEVALHDALSIASGEFVPRADDESIRPHWARAEALVAADDGRWGLLMEAVSGPTAAAWLHQNRPLQRGEATTLLAPIAEAVHVAHEHGVVGLVPDLEGVRLDSVGTPIIVSLHRGMARPALPERFRGDDALITHDRHTLAQLVLDVAEYLEGSDRVALRAVARSALESPLALREALLLAAHPEPLDPAGRREQKGEKPGLTLEEEPRPSTELGQPMPATHGPERGHVVRARVTEVLGAMGLPESIRQSVDAALDRLLSVVHPLLSWRPVTTTTVRPRFVLLGLAGLLAVCVAVAGFLDAAGSSRDDSAAAEGVSVGEGGGDGLQPEPLSSAEATSASRDSVHGLEGLPETFDEPSADEWGALVGQLLERWSACRAIQGEGCSDSVAQPRSAAALLIAVDDPRHAVIDSWLVGDRDLVVVERMGSAVLIDLVEAESTTASLLLMRSEAGWRIRDVPD